MGMIRIEIGGSFGTYERAVSAQGHGHAQAIGEVIRWLTTDVLPEAIRRDHALHEQGQKPTDGTFGPFEQHDG